MNIACRRSFAVATALGLFLAGAVLVAGPSGAQEPAAQDGGPGGEQALVSIDVDVLRSDSAVVTGTLTEVRENVEAQKAQLAAAQAAVDTARAELVAAETALAETRAELDEIGVATDAVVVGMFVSPPSESALESLASESVMDATVKQSILDRQTNADAAELDEYLALKEQLEAEEAERQAAADAAEDAEAEAAAALADVEAAVGQQAAFAVEVERRLERRLAEAAALEDVDPARAEEIRAREAEIAAALRALDEEVQAEIARQRAAELAEIADANKGITGIKPVPGGVTNVACPSGGTVQVAGDIAGQVERLLADASEAGITMCGHGYRDPAEQIAVRRANCGTSDYAIYQAPSSYCSPPTARPGTSLHEQGLAIDFTVGGGTIGWGSSAYEWLRANAADYGLYNLPGEPWHWSVDGN